MCLLLKPWGCKHSPTVLLELYVLSQLAQVAGKSRQILLLLVLKHTAPILVGERRGEHLFFHLMPTEMNSAHSWGTECLRLWIATAVQQGIALLFARCLRHILLILNTSLTHSRHLCLFTEPKCKQHPERT